MNANDIVLQNVEQNILGPRTAQNSNAMQNYAVVSVNGLGFVSPDGTHVAYHDVVNGKVTLQNVPSAHGVK